MNGDTETETEAERTGIVFLVTVLGHFLLRASFSGPVRIPGAKIPGNYGFIGNREPVLEFSGKWLVVEGSPYNKTSDVFSPEY